MPYNCDVQALFLKNVCLKQFSVPIRIFFIVANAEKELTIRT